MKTVKNLKKLKTMSNNKKRILFADLLSPQGHVKFNDIYLKSLDGIYDIIFVAQGAYMSNIHLPSSCIKTYSYSAYTSKKKGRIASIGFRLHQIRMQKYCAKLAIKEKCDAIIFSSFENVSLCFSHFQKCKVIAICHNNVEQISCSGIKQKLMRSLSKRINLVSLNRGAYEYLSSVGIKNYLLPHGYMESAQQPNSIERMFFIPINESQDAHVIEYLLSDEYCSFLDEHDCTLVIKQKIANIQQHHCEHIKIINDHPSDSEYNYYFNNSIAIILPYNSGYTLRSSGIAMEAIANDKFIIVPSTKTFLALKKEGDIGIMTYYSPDNIKQLSLYAVENYMRVSYKQVKMENSNEAIAQQIQTILS